MKLSRWLLAVPLALTATLFSARLEAASVRDSAGLFRRESVEKADRELDRIEESSRVPVTVETIDSLNGLPINEVLIDHARRAGAEGLYVLIAKKEEKIWVLSSARFGALNGAPSASVKDAFINGGLKTRDFDGALLAGVRAIGEEIGSAKVPAAPAGARPVRRNQPNGGFGLGSLLSLGLLVFGGLFLFRLLGNLFNRGPQGYAQGRPGMMGRPGYGGGAGGGGFMSGLFGGLGGAIAGNWLYDQFRGGHHGNSGYDQSASHGFGQDAGTGDQWSSTAGSGGDWSGGGDWGGGSGGDWGGGGGDGGSW